MSRMFCISMLGLILLAAACSVKDPAANIDVFPWIDSTRIPETIYAASDTAYVFSASIEDPQGPETIDAVEIRAENEGQLIWQAILADAGQPGDIIPGDGVFTTLVQAGVFAPAAAQTVQVFVSASDMDGHSADVFETSINIDPGTANQAPVLFQAAGPEQLDFDNYKHITLSAAVQDAQGRADVDSVFCDVFPPGSPVSYLQLYLNDKGEEGDETADDAVYGIEVDLDGRLSNPPVIEQVEMPGQISRSGGEPIVIRVTVSDPQGIGDIKSVYFKSYKPDGTPASEQPFFSLYDDGDEQGHGDAYANDGIYSLIIQITADNVKGAYRFEFYAEDFTELKGNTCFRFQARDEAGAKSRPVVLSVPTNLGGSVSEPMVQEIQVLD